MKKRNIPNLFIIGAPKCGTTSLHQWLGDHPQIHMSKVKEPFFFNNHESQLKLDHNSYFKLFETPNKNIAYFGEATPFYMYSKTAIKKILDTSPNSKFLITVRNPVNLFESLFYQNLKLNMENHKNLEEAWKSLDDVRVFPSLRYKKICSLAKYVREVKKYINTNNLKVITLDDLTNNPHGSMNEICGFLNVDKFYQGYSFKNYNKRAVVKFPLMNSYYLNLIEKLPQLNMGIATYIQRKLFLRENTKFEKFICEELILEKKKIEDCLGQEIFK